MSVVELKPCPFCGGEPHETDVFAYSSVKCRSCDFSITRKAGGDECAQDAWNRRAQPAEEVQPVGMFYQDLAGLYHQLRPAVVKHYPDDPGRTPLYTRPPAAEADRLDALKAALQKIHNGRYCPRTADRLSDTQMADIAAAALAGSKEKKE